MGEDESCLSIDLTEYTFCLRAQLAAPEVEREDARFLLSCPPVKTPLYPYVTSVAFGDDYVDCLHCGPSANGNVRYADRLLSREDPALLPKLFTVSSGAGSYSFLLLLLLLSSSLRSSYHRCTGKGLKLLTYLYSTYTASFDCLSVLFSPKHLKQI